MRKSVATSMLLILGLAVSPAVWSLSKTEQAITERIQPAGNVCVEGDASCAKAAASPVAAGPRSGADIYQTSCFGCHGTGAAGAPKLGDVAAWSSRVDEKGMETLVSNAITGINAMPPKGLCMDCSDEEITAAVEHILEGSK